jgi:hypothetical protein
MTPRQHILKEAERLITGDRNNQYGPPTQDFKRTAEMWQAYLGIPVRAHDVAALMCLLKLSRIAWQPEKEDSWIDIAGYAACGYETTIKEPDV